MSILKCFSELVAHSQCRDATALGLVDRVRLNLLEYSRRRKDRRIRGEISRNASGLDLYRVQCLEAYVLIE